MLLPFGVLAGVFDLKGETDLDGNVIEDSEPYLDASRRALPQRVTEIHR